MKQLIGLILLASTLAACKGESYRGTLTTGNQPFQVVKRNAAFTLEPNSTFNSELQLIQKDHRTVIVLSLETPQKQRLMFRVPSALWIQGSTLNLRAEEIGQRWDLDITKEAGPETITYVEYREACDRPVDSPRGPLLPGETRKYRNVTYRKVTREIRVEALASEGKTVVANFLSESRQDEYELVRTGSCGALDIR